MACVRIDLSSVTFFPLWAIQLLRERESLQNVVCDYRAPDICNPDNQPVPCCQRPEVLGGGAMVVSSLVLMVAMTFVTLLL